MQFRSLPGAVSYLEASRLQQDLVEMRAKDLIPDTVLFVEHSPVITRGRGLQSTGEPGPRQMPMPARLPEGFELAESERGGDLTYHGPGQLVIYPIVKLDGLGFGPKRDVGAFLRKIEAIVIAELGSLGIEARSRENATGVWVGPEEAPRKIASMGIAVRKWVTYHGIAINVVNDLAPFHLISPCGFSPEVMTRLIDQLPAGRIPADWRDWLEHRLAKHFDDAADIRKFRLDEPVAAL